MTWCGERGVHLQRELLRAKKGNGVKLLKTSSTWWQWLITEEKSSFISRQQFLMTLPTVSMLRFQTWMGNMCTLTCNLHKTCVLSPLRLWSISHFSGDDPHHIHLPCRRLPAFSLKPLLITTLWASPVFYYWKLNWGINSQDCDTPQCAASTVRTPVSVLHSYGTVAVHA